MKYTVIYKVENADDNEYSYLTSKEMTGKVGDKTAATTLNSFPPDFKEDKRGFKMQTITQQTIKGDGSTIVEVLYKRNEYAVKFHEWKSGFLGFGGSWEEISNLTITAKYGANISKKWPTYNDSSTWSTTKYLSKGPFQVNIDTMPLNGAKFYGPLIDSDSETASYYVEVLPGETGSTTLNGVTYKLHHQDTTPGTDYEVTKEDQYDITGFTYKEGTKIGDPYNNAKFYYTRNTYKVVYMNNGVKEHEESYKYEADISGAGEAYTATTPPAGTTGYVFDGWYADPVGDTKYEFTGKTMPPTTSPCTPSGLPRRTS